MDQIEDVLNRGVANIISGKEELRKALSGDKKLNVYFGIDPTATRIHLGHAVPIRKLQALAELGHNVTFLIGDFTSLIGDTSDKDSERPVLTIEQIEENFQTYKKQAEKLLDFSKISVKHNREWLAKLTFEEIVKLTQHFSVGDFVGRELIRRRLEENKRVGLHELLYPVMQGYDSYFIDADLQIGGTDQTFNMQAGRSLQKDIRGKDAFVMSTVLLEGTDGRKMSKSWGNAIWLEDEPNDMFAKVMAVDDELIIKYFTLATNTSLSDIQLIEKELKESNNPMDIKKRLGIAIVSELHNPDDAAKAQEQFERVVQNKEMPETIEEVTLSSASDNLLNEDLLVALNLASSKSEAKQLFQQGGVSLDGERILDPKTQPSIQNGSILKIGKRKIVKLKTT